MAEVAVSQLSKAFGAVKALDKVSIDFADGELYALLGPSGSGKTTLLRVIAGFEFADSGRVTIAGRSVERLAVNKRDVGMMFQSYALFPHMTVFDNVAFGLTVRGVKRREIQQRVAETLALVELSGLEKRKPRALSGGQRQRVALARALIIRPRVLLLDEPLSALDKALRLTMQIELKAIQREVGITTIFVTHDQEEALSLSDCVGVLRDGRLVQQGPPRQVYERPNSMFTATFLGEANIFEDNGAALAVRPEKMTVYQAPPIDNSLVTREATVTGHVFSGASITYLLTCRGQPIKVFCQNSGGRVIDAGAAVTVGWRPEHAVAVAS